MSTSKDETPEETPDDNVPLSQNKPKAQENSNTSQPTAQSRRSTSYSITSILQNPKSYMYPIAITSVYSIILIFLEWNSDCTNTSNAFPWNYYLIFSIVIFLLYPCYLYCIILSPQCRAKLLSDPIFALLIRTLVGNAILPVLWCIYGLISWIEMLGNPSCNAQEHLHILCGYGIIIMVYSIAFCILSVQQCIIGVEVYRIQRDQIRHIQQYSMGIVPLQSPVRQQLDDRDSEQKEQRKAEQEQEQEQERERDRNMNPNSATLQTLHIPEDKLSFFVEEMSYFDALDFSRSAININGSTSELRERGLSNHNVSFRMNQSASPMPALPAVQQLDEETTTSPTSITSTKKTTGNSAGNEMGNADISLSAVNILERKTMSYESPEPPPLTPLEEPNQAITLQTSEQIQSENTFTNLNVNATPSPYYTTPTTGPAAMNRNRSATQQSGSNMFLWEIKEMSSTMFLNYKQRNDLCCIICMNEFKKNDLVGRLMCKHIFHKECVYTWLKKNATCPLCREDVGKFANVPFL